MYPDKAKDFEGMKLYYAENKELKSKNNKIVEAGKLQFYCSPNAEISEGAYICSDCIICDNAKIEVGVYLGVGVIIRKNVIVKQGAIVTATSTNKIHNRTADEVEKYFIN